MPTVPTLADAIKLVGSIETARRTGQGDTRSNEVVNRLLAIAKAWIAQHTEPLIVGP